MGSFGTWLYRWRWLLLRRCVQIFIVLAFMLEFPLIGRIATGNLSSSQWFGFLDLSDPFIWLQSILAGAPVTWTALSGALLVAGFYALFGGRLYCSWVCPINMLTDAAYWLRQKLNIKGNLAIPRTFRRMVLLLALVLSLLGGVPAWEMVNPITLFQRELMWWSVSGSALLAGVFLFDVFVSRRGWCGHLCPVGAFYALLGRYARLRITATKPGQCKGCSASVRACPEPHVLAPVVSNTVNAVTHGDCTRCGACLDACTNGALVMELSFKPVRKPLRETAIMTKE